MTASETTDRRPTPTPDPDPDGTAGEAPRTPLSRDRILRAGVAVADAGGLDAVTMRGVADELGVEAMSLYHHVANKDALLDGMVDLVMGEVLEAVGSADTPDPATDWRGSLRARILVARRVLVTHPWAPRVIETRSGISPTFAAWFDGVLGILRAGGFSWDLAHHGMHALGSRALGFTQELFEPDDPEGGDAETEAMMAQMAESLPNLVGMLSAVSHGDDVDTLGWCDDQFEFEFGLDVILDGLDRLNTS